MALITGSQNSWKLNCWLSLAGIGNSSTPVGIVEAEEIACAKVPGQDHARCVGGTARRSFCSWSRMSEGKKRR